METNNFEANKKIARQSFEAFEKNDSSLFERITDKNQYKLHFPGKTEPLNYEEAVKSNQEYNDAFPDAKVTIEKQIAEGEYVVTRVIYSGTHKGELQGISPTNKKVTVSGLSMQRIVNGKIVEEWAEFDALGMLQKIGAIPEKLEHEEQI